MSQFSKEKQEVIYKEFSSVMNIFQKRPTKFRLAETLVFIVVLLVLSSLMETGTGMYNLLVISSTIVIIGGAPFFYKTWLTPKYVLTKKELIVELRGKKREYSLLDVERASEWRPLFLLKGKKEALMVSRQFLDRLDDQLAKIHKVKKR